MKLSEKIEHMVQHQIIARGITSSTVIRAMRSVNRSLFVPDPQKSSSFVDSPLPIGESQTISQPYIVAYMTDALDLKAGMKVLEVGTGSGYQSAVLAECKVLLYTIEYKKNLALRSRTLLKELGYSNIIFKTGSGYEGWSEYAPFDRILLTCAPPEVPQKLIKQLAPGGLLVAPVGIGTQNLVRLHKSDSGKIVEEALLAVRFVPMLS